MAEADYAVLASMRTPAKRDALRVELDRRTTTAEVLQLGKLAITAAASGDATQLTSSGDTRTPVITARRPLKVSLELFRHLVQRFD
jgi:hypothetical protein